MIYGTNIIGTLGIMSGVGFLYREFSRSLALMLDYNHHNWLAPNLQIKQHWAEVSTHEIARNGIVNDREGDWTFFLDCDVEFPPDALKRLHATLTEYELDVAVAPYFFGAPPHQPVLYAWNEQHQNFALIAKWEGDQPFPVAGAGAGCLLVRNEVFDRIEAEFPERGPFAIEGIWRTDDLPFFWKCRKLGLRVGCEPRIRVQHLRVKGYGYEDHLAHLEDVPMELLEANV